MYADGQGLYLRVDPSGARRWVQRIVVQGKRRNLGLGGWPAVSLAEAREQAIVNLQVIRAGGDPLAVKRREEKWLRKSEQGDKWNRCLIEGMIVLSETGARDEQTTPP